MPLPVMLSEERVLAAEAAFLRVYTAPTDGPQTDARGHVVVRYRALFRPVGGVLDTCI